MLLPPTALSAIVSNTGFKSKAEALITFSISPVAACCSSASSRSRIPRDLCLLPAGGTTTAHRWRLAAPRVAFLLIEADRGQKIAWLDRRNEPSHRL
jgi:hypothetical protein